MSEIRYMLDASALLALNAGRREGEAVHATLPHASVSAVNLSEVAAKLQERGVPDEVITASLAELDLVTIPFDRNQAMRAGPLPVATRAAGLSLGDGACLAAADAANAIAITTHRAWRRSILAFRSRSLCKLEAAA